MAGTLHDMHISFTVIVLQGADFFGEAERVAVQDYLQNSPSILVVLGARSSGKTALVQKVLSVIAPDSGFPPAYLNARAKQLSEASVLVSLLKENAASAMNRLSET